MSASPVVSPPATRVEVSLLAAILLIALGLRVWAIDFGLPYLYHPDEPNKIEIAQNIVKSGDLNPHYFKKPTLLIYANALLYVPYYAIGKARGEFRSPADIPPPERLAMGVGHIGAPGAVVMGRTLTALVGVLGVLLTWLLGRRVFGRPEPALFGALATAVSPVNVIQSHFIEVNAFLGTAVLGVAWYALRIYDYGTRRDYLLAGFLTGVAVSCKYPGALVAIMPVAAHWLRSGRRLRPLGYLTQAFLVMPIGFLLFTPFALIDPVNFLLGAGSEAYHYASGHSGYEGMAPLWYLEYAVQAEGPLTLLAAVGLVWALLRRLDRIVLNGVFVVAYYVFISSFEVRNSRTLLPITPFLFLLGSWLVLELVDRVRDSAPSGRRTFAAAGLALLILVSIAVPLKGTIAYDAQLGRVDSRETARVWIEQNVPRGSRIMIESYAPFVRRDEFQVDTTMKMTDHPPHWYALKGYQYLVFSEGMYARFFDDPKRYSQEVAEYQALFDRFPLVKKFEDGGYEVRIHEVVQ
ncbi:MAG TPA: glycosyltransferase family 39 protein [Gemmatimonadales bacterium]|nr:glycosyltransferase family 39 protein [Gemmatimonadales bacterium]